MRLRSRIAAALSLAFLASSPARASVEVDEEEIVFRLGGIEAQRVYLAGDFNGWNPTVDLMAADGGVFEVRLYLLPGSYRYRFVADGVSMSDPDNPCRDGEGNSCFTLLDRDGALEIVLAGSAGAASRGEAGDLAAASSIAALAQRRAFGANARAALRGTIEPAIEFDGAVGLTAGSVDERALRGESFLLRARAAYRFGDRVLRVFVRSDSIDAGGGSLLPILGSVGPYRYPAGLFCRGASIESRLPLGLESRIVYASRIRGYRSGLEAMFAPGDTSVRRVLLDGDALAARIAGRLGRTDVEGLYRFDRRPLERPGFQGDGDGEAPREGHDEVRIRGFRVSVPGESGVTIEGGALFGRVDRTAAGSTGNGDAGARGGEREWERGYRMALGVSRAGEHVDGRFSVARTTIESLSRAAADCTRDVLAGALSYAGGELRIGAGASLEIHGSGGRGERFLVAGSSFWLDGDEVDIGLLPFLSARETYEARLSIAWRRELFDGLPWGTGLAIEALRRASTQTDGQSFSEARLSSGVPLCDRAAFLLDMRGAFYRYGPARREFVDAFMGVHARLAGRHWLLLGCGVSPWDFDPWLFTYTGFGRQRYLEDRGVFEAYAARGERAAVLRLLDAEDALAEEWAVTLQAGFTF